MRLRMTRVLAIVLAAAAILAGCDNNDTQPGSTTLNLNGMWKGTVSSQAGSFDFTTALTQNGNTVSGNANFASGATGTGMLFGTAANNGQTFTFTISGSGTVNNVSCTLNLNGSGQATNTMITGSFSGTNSCLPGVTSGTITLTKQ